MKKSISMLLAALMLTGALSGCGRVVSVDEVMRDLAEDIPFYGDHRYLP